MTQEQKDQLMKIGLALGAVWLVYKFGPNPLVKTAAASVGAVIVAKQIPVLSTALA